MKRTILYACGHSSEILLVGSIEDQSRKEAQMKLLDCPKCSSEEEPGKPEREVERKEIAMKNEVIKIRLDSNTKKAIQKIAARENRTFAGQCGHALAIWLEDYEKQEKGEPQD